MTAEMNSEAGTEINAEAEAEVGAAEGKSAGLEPERSQAADSAQAADTSSAATVRGQEEQRQEEQEPEAAVPKGATAPGVAMSGEDSVPAYGLMGKLGELTFILTSQAFWQRVLLSGWGSVIVSLLLGVGSTAGFAPVDMWVITFACLTLFICLIRQLSAARIALCTLCYFFALNAATLPWVNYVMENFGQMPAVLAWTLELLFSLYLAAPYALFTYAAARLIPPRAAGFGVGALPLALVLADFFIGWFLSGFPWMYLGYIALSGPLSGYAPLIGVRGISLLIYLSAAALALASSRRYLYLPLAALIFTGGVLLQDQRFTKDEEEVQFSLVQGNIPPLIKWSSQQSEHSVQTYLNLSLPEFTPKRVVIWPESALPLYLEYSGELISSLQQLCRHTGSYLMTGILRREEGQSYNSLIALGSDHREADKRGEPAASQFEQKDQESETADNDQEAESTPEAVQIYDKRHLVPFGEYVPLPWLLRRLGPMFNLPSSDLVPPAAGQSSPLRAAGTEFIPAICYEAIFPELIASLDSEETGAIVMVSNDSWFGPSRGPLEHLNIARMRSMELQKPMLRATNGGITAVIDATGKVRAQLPADTRTVLSGSIPTAVGLTPYAQWGNVPLFILLLILALFAWYLRREEDPTQELTLQELVRP
ncbi:MAG: apolipoprotein N-acyltransferase [Succinivibrio sp.]|nr:apolipoprotein N-acyltransferase [Succinivibrio sp.]